jgi:chromosome segregation ATPase
MRWSWCVIVGVLAGCDSGAPDCRKAVSVATKLASDDALLSQLLADSCQSGWTGAQRTCVAAAKTLDGMIACVPELTDVMQARLESAKAKAEADKAMAAAKAAGDEVAKLAADLDALNDKVAKAVDAIVQAKTDAERAAAKTTLDSLRKEKSELEQRVAEAKAASARAERMKGVHISKECLDNPLAKGCQ